MLWRTHLDPLARPPIPTSIRPCRPDVADHRPGQVGRGVEGVGVPGYPGIVRTYVRAACSVVGRGKRLATEFRRLPHGGLVDPTTFPTPEEAADVSPDRLPAHPTASCSRVHRA